ncbi:hypothetical protein [Nocardioides sp.]|uniref:hypothetical protein n=1 Tax=Nocardioides sp. TaxID=35761 RepID=UPI002736FDC2|nr:hypothetical protein [Nocardioides sp.]MDP3891706.1 hypothetical protein [Nocardioides sp.]
MSRSLGTKDAPPAARATTPGWRDPRLWVGVAIVAASVLAGARILGGADDAVAVWAVADDMGAGDAVVAADLVPVRVRFGEAAAAGRYLAVDDGLPEQRQLARGLGAGELLPRAALSDDAAHGVQQVPVWAPTDAVPPGVSAGSVVDVWAVPEDNEPARLLLDDVVVLDAPRGSDSFGPAGTRQLVLGVPRSAGEDLARAITATVKGGIVITRQG